MNEREHQKVADLLSAYIDGEIDAQERVLVERHLAECEQCAHQLQTLRQTVALLHQLPPVAAPRPFTLTAADVRLAHSDTKVRRGWRQSFRVPALAGAVAALLCVVLVGGVLLVNQTNPARLAGARPQATAQIAFGTQMQTEPPQEEMIAAAPKQERAAEPTQPPAPEVEEAAVEVASATPPAMATETESGAQALVAQTPAELEVQPTTVEETQSDKALSSAVILETETAAAPTSKPAPSPSPTPQPMVLAEESVAEGEATADEAAGAGQLPAAAEPAPLTVVPVENLQLTIKPGIITVTGELPLPAGQTLQAELWRDGQLIDWAGTKSLTTTVEAQGRFSLRLEARPDLPGADLLAANAAEYEIRLIPINPPMPVEARIPFDTYLPPTKQY